MYLVAAGDLVSLVEGLPGYASENPVEVAGVVVGLLVLVGGGFALYRYLTRSPVSRLKSILADYDAVTVLMHPNPDPDAMSSALAVDQLAAAGGTDANLCYTGEIRRPENRAFQTVLDLDFERVESVGDIDTDAVVLVDHNEPRGFAGAEEIDPVAVVDHHPGGGTGLDFTDVRPETGACATIFAEYFESLDWDFFEVDVALTDGGVDTADVPADAMPSHVATGLIYGIQSDTRSLTNGCSAADFAAAAYLYEGVDSDLLNRIANPQVDAEVLDVKSRAISERVVNAPYGFSDVGEVSNTDAIPQAADELETLEGVSAVVVIGEKEGIIRIAGRSRDDRVHIGRAIEAVVDDIPMAEGGGHARMGGGKIPIEYMDGIGPSEGVTREQLQERIFAAMAGER
ncbi:DHHA1 domain-containing protein [Haloarcula sp. S1CR25-12]|uniref:DHHA1 domain-containing protein n=1 Tax=Haloarcula saliterrae TaxID=2950534 RepID=A0ABU2F6N4_9EURY|nr:DHHA1 domain-containing protein [Haloarcula sp. S1CR25-12]MDS0257919.1 DHHA1 domain-containing protein [Haloarcula sp. S1CR25-12]